MLFELAAKRNALELRAEQDRGGQHAAERVAKRDFELELAEAGRGSQHAEQRQQKQARVVVARRLKVAHAPAQSAQRRALDQLARRFVGTDVRKEVGEHAVDGQLAQRRQCAEERAKAGLANVRHKER